MKKCYLSAERWVLLLRVAWKQTKLIYLSLTIGSFVGCYDECEKEELGRCNQQKPVNLDSIATLPY